MPTSSQLKRQAENEARVAQAEAAKAERKAVKKISHRDNGTGGARSVQELRDMCEDLGISTGGFRDDLIKRIRAFQKEKEEKEAKAREKALAKAREKAEAGVEKGVAMLDEEDWIGAAAAFEFAAKVLADYHDSSAFKTAQRCLKQLRNRLNLLEQEAASKLKDFFADERARIGRKGRTAEEDRAAERMLSAIERDFGPEPDDKEVGTTGRCRICTLSNPCPNHTTTEQRAHKVVTTLTLVDPESEKAEKRKLVASYMVEEESRARHFESLAAAEERAKREFIERAQLAASEAKRVADTQARFEDKQKRKKEMEAKRERRMRDIWRQEAIDAEKRRNELERHQNMREVRVKHLKQAVARRSDSHLVENSLLAMANSRLGSKLTRERVVRKGGKYDRMIAKDRVEKQKEAEKRRKELEEQVAFGMRRNEEEMAAQAAALTSPKKGDIRASSSAYTSEGALLLKSDAPVEVQAARRAADAVIWGLVEEALTAPLPQVERKLLSDDHERAMVAASDRQLSLAGAAQFRGLSTTADERERREALVARGHAELREATKMKAAAHFGSHRSVPMLQNRQGVRVSLSLPDVPTPEPSSREEALEVVLRGTSRGTAHNARQDAARDAADSIFWDLADAALRRPLPIGVSVNLPQLPSPKPIEAGQAGSEWGMDRRAPIRKQKHAIEKRLADIELDRVLGEQEAEDARWRKVEEEGTVVIEIVRARKLKAMDITGHADPYATCSCDYEFEWDSPHDRSQDNLTSTSVRTFVKKQTKNPRWDETFELHNVHNLAKFTITVWDWDRRDNDDPMGAITLKVREMRGNMWQKQKEGQEDAIATTAAEHEMEKRQKLLQARVRLQAAQESGAVATAEGEGDKPVLMLGNGETDEDQKDVHMDPEVEQQEEGDADPIPLEQLTVDAPPGYRLREEEWYTLQPVPPSPDNPDGCLHPEGQISVRCTATFQPRGPNYVTVEMRQRRLKIATMSQDERHEVMGRFFLKWRLTWRPAPPQTPELVRRRRRLDEQRQALEDEFDQFVDLTERRAAAPLVVASANDHLSAHTEELRRQREEIRLKEEETEQRAADVARERRLQLTGGLFGL